MSVLTTYGNGALEFTRQDGLEAIPYLIVWFLVVTLLGLWIERKELR